MTDFTNITVEHRTEERTSCRPWAARIAASASARWSRLIDRAHSLSFAADSTSRTASNWLDQAIAAFHAGFAAPETKKTVTIQNATQTKGAYMHLQGTRRRRRRFR
jgi:hypothetical protein